MILMMMMMRLMRLVHQMMMTWHVASNWGFNWLLQFLRLKTTWHCLKCNKDDYDDNNRDDSKSADDDNGYEDDIGEDIFEDDGDERYDDSDVDCNTMIMMTRKEPEAVLTRKWRWRVNDMVEDLESESMNEKSESGAACPVLLL